MNITKNFTYEELTSSASAKKHGIDNTPSEQLKKNIYSLCENVLQPLRDYFGAPITVSSGFRCEALNKAVGGAKTSAHCTGLAADLKAKDMASFQRAVLAWAEDADFDQIIIEYPNAKNVASWIHIGYKNNQGKKRKQIIYTLDGKKYFNAGAKFYLV